MMCKPKPQNKIPKMASALHLASVAPRGGYSLVKKQAHPKSADPVYEQTVAIKAACQMVLVHHALCRRGCARYRAGKIGSKGLSPSHTMWAFIA